MLTRPTFFISSLLLLPFTGAASYADETVSFYRQLGTTGEDEALCVAANATGAFVGGYVSGALPGQTNNGFIDGFVQKYSAEGDLLWTHEFGPAVVHSMVAIPGGVYVAGTTGVALPGQPYFGFSDAFVRKYDNAGKILWTRQFGTSGSDMARGITVSGQSVYVVGHTNSAFPGQVNAGYLDAFVRKYSASGSAIWTRQFGSTQWDIPFGVAANTGGVFVVGYTPGKLPGQKQLGYDDAFVRRYDTNGKVLWTRQFGTLSGEQAYGAACDNTGVYIVGDTSGALDGTPSGGTDAFVRKYSMSGIALWTRQFGSPENDPAKGIAIDASGVYVAGSIFQQDQTAPFVRKYDRNGRQLWNRDLPREGDSGYSALSIALAARGIFLAGHGTMSSKQPRFGGTDGFILKMPN